MASQPGKICRQCKHLKPLEEFVNISGIPNPRGHKCQACYTDNIKRLIVEALNGRDSCIYCDRVIPIPPPGKYYTHFLERDHMDPISRGGWDHEDNLIFCCKGCNQRKRDTLFSDWLKMIPPACATNARKAYLEKHCYEPEDFFPFDPQITITIRLGTHASKEKKGDLMTGAEYYSLEYDEATGFDHGEWERWYVIGTI